LTLHGFHGLADEEAEEFVFAAFVLFELIGIGGKDKLFGFFVGQAMKAMKGQGNPQIVNELLKKKL